MIGKCVAVLIPAYNEAETISKILELIPHSVLGHKIVLVVSDDHSSDDTVEIAGRFTSHVVTTKDRTGVGGNTRRGLTHITELKGVEYVVKLDGDGQHDPTYLHEVVRVLQDKAADVVTCSRFHPDSNPDDTLPLNRIILNRLMSRMVSDVTGWNITDARTGFMGFRFDDIASITNELIIEGYGIPMEILLRLWKKNKFLEVFEIPHPANYKKGISARLDQKYSTESYHDQSDRLKIAYEALLRVLADMSVDNVDSKAILRPQTKRSEINFFRPQFQAVI